MNKYCSTPLLPYILILHQNVHLRTLEFECPPTQPQDRKERERESFEHWSIKTIYSVLRIWSNGPARSISGCKVVIASRDLDKSKAAADEMSKIGQVTPLKCNIRSEEEVKYVQIYHLTNIHLLDTLLPEMSEYQAFPSP